LKIREHTLQKIPYLLVVGKRESEQNTVSVRTRKGEDLGVISIEQLIEKLQQEV
jgi:threonyl-tRNA synthetase